jgi:uncharacterized membrane protein (DUF106 family)
VCLTGTEMKDGTVMKKMKEGQCMMMDGKMTMHSSDQRPMMKK